MRLEAPGASPGRGVVLEREWVADWFETFCSVRRLDGLLISLRRSAGQLAGLLLAALRLNLPTVVAPRWEIPFDIVPYALGLAPLTRDPAEAAVAIVLDGGPRVRGLVDGFSLANALRAGLAAGAGPELLVHLAAIAREAGELDFPRVIRVLAPETPTLIPSGSMSAADLLSSLGDALNDVSTVDGQLREVLPEPTRREPKKGNQLSFVTGRASGVEAIASTPPGVKEVAGACRVFGSEEEAARAVEAGEIVAGELLVVCGCGPRGGPGLLRLDLLARTLAAGGLEASVPVITDGLPPAGAGGTWISLFSPEAAAGGVIGRLHDGDTLRIDLAEGRIRTGVQADEMERRDPYKVPDPAGAGYAARYARSALPAIDGSGFG